MGNQDWLKALYNEDCVRVLELLKAHPVLLREGLSEESWRVIEGTSTWKGRTALHVGARRGSVELVKAVLAMCEDDELGHVLAAKDGWYKLDALAMAVVNGNRDIILILAKESLQKCKTNPYDVSSGWEVPLDSESLESSTSNSRMQLRQITKQVMETPETLGNAESIKDLYRGSRDFNFLPWEEYLFHFTFLKMPKWEYQRILDEVRHNIFDRTASSAPLRSFLCELQDGQGRTALHVAVDEGTVLRFLLLLPQDSPDAPNLLRVEDGTGKMALHRAAAMKNPESLRVLLGDDRIDLRDTFRPWDYTEWLWTMRGIDMERVSKNNGVEGFALFDMFDHSNALQISIIHQRSDCVRLLLDDKYNSYRAKKLDLRHRFTRIFGLRNGENARFGLEPLQLAAVVGDTSILRMLLQNESIRDPGRPSTWPSTISCSVSNPWPALHLVAASGKFQSLKLFMDNEGYDVMVEDLDENTTLHHATKGSDFQFSVSLVDLTNCQHAMEYLTDDQGGQTAGRKEDVERQGCIELLLQVGFDIWKTNKAKQGPYPGPDASAEMLAWWYKKLAKETIAHQNTFNGAANAITVTAALVAATSFQGPLQPPLGWNSTTQQMEVTSLPMRIFIVCDTLSFYLAVAAIMSALIPSLPMPQESTMDELRRTRRMVAIGVGFLFPSIVSILLAFAAASIAVIPNNQGSWNHKGVTITSASIGGLVCLCVICLFFVRLLRLIFYRNIKIRNLFKATTF